ncbi:cupin-like domain-containing protein [Laspinema olomoucense]|uniref:Cupin-like domain-containing protein n=1 Tax=Laspinema olomoucense D3b TaxID=2953688 RepID=A0ABT2NEL3_9CYAN|nr:MULTISPECIES: cupin-like domain-containing protein [unclassified Laspinema]MCT7972555.1 cupin-like domain-containing protein [Laspinema sp. D3d]MCT7981145.1 cupin-like domain-containing protein [Laspinema sp. D3b]MCT7988712.1 cupin-like domain-containing protein [Laspinema sp. D3a]
MQTELWQGNIISPSHSGLPNEWKRWIMSSKLRQIPDGQLVDILVQRGVDIRMAIAEVKAVSAHPYFQAASAMLAEQTQQAEAQIATQAIQVQKLETQLDIYRQLEKLNPNYNQVQRVESLSRPEFFENYFAQNTPVILTGIMGNWQALSRWNPEYLKQEYGEVAVEVQFNRESNPLFEREKEKHRQQMKMGEYVDLIVQGGKTNDYYMVPFNGNFDSPELKPLLKEVEIFTDYIDPSNQTACIFFWFGPEGTITPLHHDPCNVLLSQVYGKKRIRLISPNQKALLYNYVGVYSEVDLLNPDYEKYPRFKDVEIIEVILEPGEVIFLPVGWWHHVEALDISISVSFTNFWINNYYNI